LTNDVLDEIYDLFGADFGQGLRLNPLSKLIDCDEQVGQALGRLLEGSHNVQTPYGERPGNGDHLESLGWGVNLSSKILAPPAGSYNLRCVACHGRPVETLLERLSDQCS
jgi:hypothetical protein